MCDESKGTGSFGKRRNKTHTLCVRCGRCRVGVFIYRRVVVPLVGSPRHARGSAIRRKTTGTARMRFLCHVPRRFKTNFREGTQASPKQHVGLRPVEGIEGYGDRSSRGSLCCST